MEGIVHIAGLHLSLNAVHVRQRCLWCGATLVDVDLTTASVAPHIWPSGTFIRKVADGECCAVEFVPGTPAPEEACVRLDPAVTA